MYFLEARPAEGLGMMRVQEGRDILVNGYPWSAVGVNVTHMLLLLFDLAQPQGKGQGQEQGQGPLLRQQPCCLVRAHAHGWPQAAVLECRIPARWMAEDADTAVRACVID